MATEAKGERLGAALGGQGPGGGLGVPEVEQAQVEGPPGCTADIARCISPGSRSDVSQSIFGGPRESSGSIQTH